MPMLFRTILSPALAVACLGMFAIERAWGAAGPDYELGEYLAGECTTCHRRDSVDAAIPSIFGIPRNIFIEAMIQYRDGRRINQAMRSVAQSLNEEEIAALGAFLEQASSAK